VPVPGWDLGDGRVAERTCREEIVYGARARVSAAQDDEAALGRPGQSDGVIQVVRRTGRGYNDGVERGGLPAVVGIWSAVSDESLMAGALVDDRPAILRHRLASVSVAPAGPAGH
jgi:hypothetical protein